MARALYVCRARRGFVCVGGGLCDIGSLCVMAEALWQGLCGRDCVAGTVWQGLRCLPVGASGPVRR